MKMCMHAPNRNVPRRINTNANLFLCIEKKSHPQTREAIRERIQLSKGRERMEENNIPPAKPKARKRKGNGMALESDRFIECAVSFL